MNVQRDFDGRRVLVTGGTKGTGAATAARLRTAGATVVTTARSLPANHPDPANFIAADTATVTGTQTVIDQLQGARQWTPSSTWSEGPTRRQVVPRP